MQGKHTYHLSIEPHTTTVIYAIHTPCRPSAPSQQPTAHSNPLVAQQTPRTVVGVSRHSSFPRDSRACLAVLETLVHSPGISRPTFRFDRAVVWTRQGRSSARHNVDALVIVRLCACVKAKGQLDTTWMFW